MNTRQEADEWLDELDANKPLKNGFKRVSNYNWGRCNALVNKCRKTDNAGLHRRSIAKYISYLKLRNILWVSLFHWFTWRYLHWFKSPEWMRSVLEVVLSEDNKDANDFFASWSLIQRNHLMTETTSKLVTTTTTEAKQDSEADTTQL